MSFLSSIHQLILSPNSRPVPAMNCHGPVALTLERASRFRPLSITERNIRSRGTSALTRIGSIMSRYLPTRSSHLLGLPRKDSDRRAVFLHADGAPDRASFLSVEL